MLRDRVRELAPYSGLYACFQNNSTEPLTNGSSGGIGPCSGSLGRSGGAGRE